MRKKHPLPAKVQHVASRRKKFLERYIPELLVGLTVLFVALVLKKYFGLG
jgi:hypothetical protein